MSSKLYDGLAALDRDITERCARSALGVNMRFLNTHNHLAIQIAGRLVLVSSAAPHSPAGSAETKNPASRSHQVQNGVLAVAVGAAAGSFRVHHRESGNRVLRFADFEIDVAQKELRRGGEIVNALSARTS
jgi:hypothetical protein